MDKPSYTNIQLQFEIREAEGLDLTKNKESLQEMGHIYSNLHRANTDKNFNT